MHSHKALLESLMECQKSMESSNDDESPENVGSTCDPNYVAGLHEEQSKVRLYFLVQQASGLPFVGKGDSHFSYVSITDGDRKVHPQTITLE